MERRAYLATVAAALGVAGCSSSDDLVTDTPRRTTATTTSTPTSTPTDTPTETAQPPSETDTPEPTETETPENTPDPGAAARPHIEDVKAAVQAGYRAYVSQGDTERLLGVTAASSPFSQTDVTQEFDEADIPMQKARASGPTDDQRQYLDRLETLMEVLGTLARAQNNVTTGYDQSKSLPDAVLDGDLNALESAAGTLQDRGETATDVVDDVGQLLSNNPGEAVTYLDHDELTAKIDQLQREASSLEGMGESYSRVSSGFETYAKADRAYDEKRWDAAREDYGRAADEFMDANDAFDDISPPESVADRMEDMLEVTEALETGSRDLANAAAAQADGSETFARQKVRSAHSEFDSAGLEDNDIL